MGNRKGLNKKRKDSICRFSIIMTNHKKISVHISSRGDGQFIKECIDNMSPYVDEIIISDVDDRTVDIIENIKNSSSIPIIYKKNYEDDIRHMISGDYILHVDRNDISNTDIITNIRGIVNDYLKNDVLPTSFRFPRANNSNNIFNIRLWQKKLTPKISLHKNSVQDIDENIINMITVDYPTTHIYKGNIQLKKRNPDKETCNHKKLLILSIFKNSDLWTNDILECMANFYQFNDMLYDNNPDKLDINFSFIDGYSSDGTFQMLENYRRANMSDVQLAQFDPSNDLYVNNECSRFIKLAQIRNRTIEQSVIQFPLGDDDYILFADSDIKFNEQVIYGLIKDMEMYHADIIAPLIYIEDFREFGNSYFYDTLAFRNIYGFRFNHVMQLNDIDMNIPNEVYSVGSFYLMKYKVAKNVKYTGEKDSEQVEFCNNARAKGFKIFVSPKLSVLHVNLDKYGLEWH